MPTTHRVPTLLVIDDDPAVQLLLRRALEGSPYGVQAVATAAEGLERVRSGEADVIVHDVVLPDMSGIDSFRRLREIDARVPVIFITAATASDMAIEAMKLGAFDYLLKPLSVMQVRSVVTRAFDIRRLMREPVAIGTGTGAAAEGTLLVGRSAPMQEAYKAIGRVARQDVTVLIRGESGTGKELVARAIYQHSHRALGPFLTVNCAAIPETLLESELFGHERGAFTGADRIRIGKFEQCSGGTLFLDEIGDLALSAQSKVLRVLQEQTFERLGGDKPIRTDVRVIAATNRHLEEMVARKLFREDLFYRLNVFSIYLPPLRERPEDLVLLIEHYLARLGRELGRDVRGVSPEASDALLAYSWPGNVRELQNVLRRALLQSAGPVLIREFLPNEVVRPPPGPPPGADGEGLDWERYVDRRLRDGAEGLYAEALAEMERRLLARVLQHVGGNQIRAARILGLARGTLRNKIRALGINIARVVTNDNDAGHAP